ncbi:hypothetical protein QBC41DRAFT_395130 [Cercophora samala]|uniref:DUF7580 domain-containing protein n=1 Tax=Cercophora samala TaxID=330535 RepID=A0AA39ZB95_9PEZI|nr:hypothetical protein QBC41DRAFT_395130 [Cercophora samala]
MSGFEIAGVVLGSVPIVVSALQLYVKGANNINRLRFATKEAKSLTRSLQTEHIKLQNVYEKLLADIVPERQIEAMINEPFGPLWSAPDTAIRIQQRLWRSSKLFQEVLNDMNDAMAEIRQKLDIGPDGEVQWMKLSTIQKEYKRIVFVLRRSEYQDALSKLKEGVSSLEGLLQMNIQLEPDRRRRSQGNVYRLLRDVSSSIYQALCSAVTCGCPGLHDFGFKLINRPVTRLPCWETDEEILSLFKFSLSVSSASTGFEAAGAHWGSVKMWDSLSLSILPSNKSPDERTVRFLPLTPASDSNLFGNLSVDSTAAALNMTPINLNSSPSKISNICHSIRKARTQLDGAYCGCISDLSQLSPRSYRVYALGRPNEGGEWTLVSLKSVLAGEVPAVPPLLYGDKLWLAWTIASSVTQLRGTYWYMNPPTHDDLYLVRQDGIVQFREVFVVKRLPDQSISPTSSLVPANHIHPTLVALGVLLIEVIFGQVLSKIRPREADLHSILTSYEAVMQLLSAVNTLGGPNYYSAVRKCIKCEVLDDGGMGSEEGQKDVFVGILNLLEQDLEMAMS